MANKKILVVDDEPEFVDAVRMRLEANGYEVISASNGKEGLEKARKERPALILLDLVMPESNGFEALSNIKSYPQIAQIPIVIITAKSETEYVLDAGRLGANDYLVKPVDMGALLDMVKKHVGG